MKKRWYFLLAATLIICFGVALSASAAAESTAKQIMIDRLQSSDFIPAGEINKTSTGTAYYQVKTMSGVLVTSIDSIAKLSGADLKLDYKLDTPESKMAMNYTVNYDGAKYSGGMFIDSGRLIMTTELMKLLGGMGTETISTDKLPEYVYMNNPGYANMWGNINKGQYFPPELKNLLVFMAEAIPEKHFAVSLASQKVSFTLDQDGFEDVLLAEFTKVANEKERFAQLVADYITAYGGDRQTAEKMKSDIVNSIEQSINNGSYPDSRDEIEKAMAGIINLKELKFDASIIPGGQNSFNMALGVGDGKEFGGNIVLDTDFTSGKELLNGTYSLDIDLNITKQQASLKGNMRGSFSQTASDSNSKETIELKATDNSLGINMLDIVIEGNASARAYPDVQVNIPVLTPVNSADLEKLVSKTPAKNTPTVILNGKVLTFDVAPYIAQVENGSRVLVPLRNLMEALGCEVSWIEPDQINIVRGGTTINMFINKTGYLVNGEEKQLDAPPFIIGGRTMVPLRFVAQELGCTVEYNSGTNTVNIHSN